jgi:hypothetical protein
MDMKGNGTSQLVAALRGIKQPGLSITTGTVAQAEPLLVRLSGSNLLLNGDDVDMLKHISPADGDTLLLLVSEDGQQYYALGVM